MKSILAGACAIAAMSISAAGLAQTATPAAAPGAAASADPARAARIEKLVDEACGKPPARGAVQGDKDLYAQCRMTAGERAQQQVR